MNKNILHSRLTKDKNFENLYCPNCEKPIETVRIIYKGRGEIVEFVLYDVHLGESISDRKLMLYHQDNTLVRLVQCGHCDFGLEGEIRKRIMGLLTELF